MTSPFQQIVGFSKSNKDLDFGWARSGQDQEQLYQRLTFNLKQVDAGLRNQFAANPSKHLGLKYAYFGGVVDTGSAWLIVPAGDVLLADNATNYVQRLPTGEVSFNQIQFEYPNKIPMAEVRTRGGEIADVIDRRPILGTTAGEGAGGSDPISFPEILGTILNSQVPLAAVQQWETFLIIGATQITGLFDTNWTVTGLWNFIANGGGDLDEYDLEVGDTTTPDYGILRIGDAILGRTSHTAADGPPTYNLNGAFVFQNPTGPITGDIEFAFLDSAGLVRFALPKSAVGNATYSPRSMLIAGPAIADSDVVTVAYWQSQGIFHNLEADTAKNGADLGVQNDLEVEGEIFVDELIESTPGEGITINGVKFTDRGAEDDDHGWYAAAASSPARHLFNLINFR